MIKKFNEYIETEKFNDDINIPKEEIFDLLYELESNYIIKLIPIRFEAKSNLSPKKKFCLLNTLIQVGTVQIEGFKFGFLTDWCDNGFIWPIKFNGVGYKLNIITKDGTHITKTNELKKILKSINQRRLKVYGLKAQIIRSSFSFSFIAIFKIK